MVAELAGHNVASFDVPFLRRYFELCSLFYPASFIPLDTLQLARWWKEVHGIEIENLKLGTLASFFGIELGADAHDALADVRANVEVARRMVEDLGGRRRSDGKQGRPA